MDLRLRYRFIPVVSIVVFLVLFVVFSWRFRQDSRQQM